MKKLCQLIKRHMIVTEPLIPECKVDYYQQTAGKTCSSGCASGLSCDGRTRYKDTHRGYMSCVLHIRVLISHTIRLSSARLDRKKGHHRENHHWSMQTRGTSLFASLRRCQRLECFIGTRRMSTYVMKWTLVPVHGSSPRVHFVDESI